MHPHVLAGSSQEGFGTQSVLHASPCILTCTMHPHALAGSGQEGLDANSGSFVIQAPAHQHRSADHTAYRADAEHGMDGWDSQPRQKGTVHLVAGVEGWGGSLGGVRGHGSAPGPLRTTPQPQALDPSFLLSWGQERPWCARAGGLSADPVDVQVGCSAYMYTYTAYKCDLLMHAGVCETC